MGRFLAGAGQQRSMLFRASRGDEAEKEARGFLRPKNCRAPAGGGRERKPKADDAGGGALEIVEADGPRSDIRQPSNWARSGGAIKEGGLQVPDRAAAGSATAARSTRSLAPFTDALETGGAGRGISPSAGAHVQAGVFDASVGCGGGPTTSRGRSFEVRLLSEKMENSGGP